MALPLGLLSSSLLSSSAAAGELRGRVTSSSRPAAGVTVAATAFESPHDAARRAARGGPAAAALASTTTRPDGTFTLTVAPEAASLVLRVDGASFVPVRLAGLFDGSTDTNVGDVHAAEASTLSGRVVDARGAAVAGATLTLEPGVPPFAGDALVAEAVTTRSAADGSFRFDRASSSGNRLRIDAAGLASSSLAGRASRSAGRSRSSSRPRRSSPAGCQQADGRTPASAALVRFEGAAATPGWRRVPMGASVSPACPQVRGASWPTPAPWAAPRVPVRGTGPAAALSLVLARPAVLAGRIVDARSGPPVPRARVEAHGDAAPTWWSAVGSRRALPSRSGSLRAATGDRRRAAPRALRARRRPGGAGRTTTVDLPLTLGATLSGRRGRRAGAPVAGAAVSPAARGRASAALPRSGATPRRVAVPHRARRDLPGRASGPGSEPAARRVASRVRAAHRGGDRSPRGVRKAGCHRRAAPRPRGPRARPRRRRPTDRGRRDRGPALGLRAQRARRRLHDRVRGAAEPRRPAERRRGADGRFRIAGLSPGAYSVHAHHDGHADDEPRPGAGRARRARARRGAEAGRRRRHSRLRAAQRRRGGQGLVVRARPESGGDGGAPSVSGRSSRPARTGRSPSTAFAPGRATP